MTYDLYLMGTEEAAIAFHEYLVSMIIMQT
jgi:hypothetical protein